MNAEQYRAVIGWFNARPAAKKALRLVSRGAVGLVYLLYLGMLAWLALHRSEQLLPAAIVPAAAFLVGTLVRRVINRPRPYTALGFAPLFPKDKPGQSMPSRHCFSAAAIAGAAWFVLRPLGIVLAVLGVLIAILLLGLLPHASADYIHWVDFRLSAPVLRSALELDMASQGGEQPLDWIDILALAAAWRGGTGVTVADTQRAAQALRGDTPPERLPGMAGRCFSYYRAAYGAALGGLVGHFAIRRTDPQTDEAEWIPAYGLKAFSPIAAGYPWSHYPDFGAQRSYGYARPHLGNDILGALGTPICAVEGGTVEALGWNRYGGWRVGIRSHDRKRYYYYAHLRKDRPYAPGLREGDTVQAGDVIEWMYTCDLGSDVGGSGVSQGYDE